MRLYYTPGTCSLSPHIVARELGIDLKLVKVDIATGTTEDGSDYRRINIHGQVPALALDNGTVLTEGPAIVQFLADLKPESGLAPAPTSFDRYRLQQWLNFISSELHKGFAPLWRKDTPADTQRTAKETLAAKFGLLDQHLATADYLLGKFTVADAYAFTVLNWAGFMSIDLGRWPNVSAYFERVRARPNVRAALIAEGLISAAASAA